MSRNSKLSLHEMKLEAFLKDPFRLFFPLGAIFVLIGVAPWLLLIGDAAVYPAQFHKMIMINGFILSFVCGFLMTAIPRFTKSAYAHSVEVIAVLFFLLLTVGLSFFENPAWHYLAAVCTQLALILFAARRFVQRQSDPPISFTFVGIGLFMWMSSNFYFFLLSQGIASPDWNSQWQAVFSNGAILSLILGIGSRLLPALLGWQEVLPKGPPPKRQKILFLGLTGVFLLTYFVSLPMRAELALRLAIVLFLALRYWKLWRFPKTRNGFNWNLWLSSWCVVLAMPLFWIQDERAIHFLHFLLVGGFAWMTFLISLHVVIAHQEKPDFSVKDSKIFLLLGLFLLGAMITRVTAVLWPNVYLRHLGYAALTLLFGLILWAWIFLQSAKQRSVN